jgi:hypothetical protein
MSSFSMIDFCNKVGESVHIPEGSTGGAEFVTEKNGPLKTINDIVSTRSSEEIAEENRVLSLIESIGNGGNPDLSNSTTKSESVSKNSNFSKLKNSIESTILAMKEYSTSEDEVLNATLLKLIPVLKKVSSRL